MYCQPKWGMAVSNYKNAGWGMSSVRAIGESLEKQAADNRSTVMESKQQVTKLEQLKKLSFDSEDAEHKPVKMSIYVTEEPKNAEEYFQLALAIFVGGVFKGQKIIYGKECLGQDTGGSFVCDFAYYFANIALEQGATDTTALCAAIDAFAEHQEMMMKYKKEVWDSKLPPIYEKLKIADKSPKHIPPLILNRLEFLVEETVKEQKKQELLLSYTKYQSAMLPLQHLVSLQKIADEFKQLAAKDSQKKLAESLLHQAVFQAEFPLPAAGISHRTFINKTDHYNRLVVSVLKGHTDVTVKVKR